MQIWAESGKSALPICNYSQILYQFLTFTQNLKRSHRIENKHTFPSMQIFFYICEYLNITPQDFFNTSTVNPIKLQQLIPELGKLNNNQLDIILNITNEFLHH